MILIVSIVFITLILIFNQTPLFYREDNDYTQIKEGPVIEGGETFESINGNKKAVLFIHGFPGSAKMFYLIRDLAIKSGYDVYNPRLPGFACEIDDLVKTNFSQWYNYIRDYYVDKRGSYDEFYIVGTSMGGALTLKLTQEFNKDHIDSPTAIAVTAAPVFINHFFKGVVKNPLLYFARMISLFKDYIPPKRPRKSKEFDEDGDTEWVGHKGIFPKQIYSLLLALRGIRKNLHTIEIPCYLCQAKEDKTVPFENLYYIMERISSDDIKTKVFSLKQWKHTNHSLFLYKSVGPKLWEEINSFFMETKDT